MIELKGKYNNAKIFTNNVEEKAKEQIQTVLNQKFSEGSVIRIMPDTHAGSGCTIGTTMTIHDKVVPNMVGVDIGCGMETVLLKEKDIDLEKLDNAIKNRIPSGFNVRNTSHEMITKTQIMLLRCLPNINKDRAFASLGTLGGGNHFIELNKDEDDNFYLVIHSGSRGLGLQVAKTYQEKAEEYQKDKIKRDRQEIIKRLKESCEEQEISKQIKSIESEVPLKELSWIEGDILEDYLYDMNIAQEYARINRKCMVSEILDELGLHSQGEITTIHNYIDMDSNILRKGAISAKANETVLIPLNMRDGSLLCVGKGNPDWNFSAPHGAGRIMSRTKAKQSITLEDFKASMEGIYSTSVNEETIDESPFAYKPADEIIENVKDTVEITKVLKPVYNFKAGN